jgi:hypothetical protein
MQRSVGITLEPVPRLCRLRVPITVAHQERHQHRRRDDGQAEQDQAENVRHSRLPWLESTRHSRPGQASSTRPGLPSVLLGRPTGATSSPSQFPGC